MSNINIFQNQAKSIPTSDDQIVRVSMKEIEIGGRQDHLPSASKSEKLPISHVPNAGSTVGK
jgi:hypothetical protein